MIGRLYGKLVLKAPPSLMVDVGGVGYEVEAPMSTFYKLPALGEAVTLHTHLVVREDAHLLFGFGSLTERKLFRDLIRVSAIGPKLALAILSGMQVDEFWNSVRAGDVARFSKLPGIGKKTAERLIMELRDKAGATQAEGSRRAMVARRRSAPCRKPVRRWPRWATSRPKSSASVRPCLKRASTPRR